MSIKVIGAVSGVEQDVDANSKAARTTLYDAAGNPLQPNALYSGIYLVRVRQSATTAAGVVVWGLHNPSATKIVHVRRIYLEMFFDGVAAATLMEYEMGKMTGITAFSGGAAVTPSHKITSQSGVVTAVARVLDTGLTTTGGVYAAALWNGAQGRVTQTTTAFSKSVYPIYDPGALEGVQVQLAQNEALVIRQLVTSVVGDRLVGFVEIAEV